MGKTRSELREKCMVILYQVELMENSKISYDIDNLIKDNIEVESEFVKEIVYGVKTHYDEINNTINKVKIITKINVSFQKIITNLASFYFYFYC